MKCRRTAGRRLKEAIHQFVDETHNEALLQQVRDLLEPELWDQLSQEEQADIELGIAQLDAGIFLTESESFAQDKKTIQAY